MAGRGKQPKQNPVQEVSDKRRKEVYEMRLQGWSQYRIAEKLGITQGAVSQILIKVNDEFYRNFYSDIAKVKNDQVARLEHMRNELILAWDRSPKGQEDIKILDEIRKIDADIRKIYGADAPVRTINTDVDVTKLSDEILRSLVDSASESGAGTTDKKKRA